MHEDLLPAGFRFRKAEESDIDAIHDLIAYYAKDHILLPRSKDDLQMRIRNFHVAEINGVFVGCTALRDYGNGLFEIRSLAIHHDFLHQGMGTHMVSSLLRMLRERGGDPIRVFALTYQEPFFRRLGFRIVDKSLFPEKIWSDCAVCPKKDRCDEIAVLMEIGA